MKISTIHGLQRYLKRNSGFSGKTINSVIIALGYHPLHSTSEEFKELSGIFFDCFKNGADSGFTGFSYYTETIKFFKKHQIDIVSQMENKAAEFGTDVISFILKFRKFRNSIEPPTPSEVGKALWNKKLCWTELYELYNVFAWYALEEVSRTWYTYLEDNPAYKAELAA